jgi:hypothetical protein
MKPAYWAALVMLVGAACLTGCTDGQKACLGGGQAVLAARGDIWTSQVGNTVVVDLKLTGVPERVRSLAMGLRLRDGTALYPSAMLILPGPAREWTGKPPVRFGFDGSSAVAEGLSADGSPVSAGPDVCLQMQYQLEEGSVGFTGGVFWLALGEPDGPSGTAAGITCGLSLDEGAPFYTCYGLWLRTGPEMAGFPLLAEPRRSVPMVGVLLDEPLAASAGGRVVSMPLTDAFRPISGADTVLLSKRVKP